jgi:hypothetical protein
LSSICVSSVGYPGPRPTVTWQTELTTGSQHPAQLFLRSHDPTRPSRGNGRAELIRWYPRYRSPTDTRANFSSERPTTGESATALPATEWAFAAAANSEADPPGRPYSPNHDSPFLTAHHPRSLRVQCVRLTSIAQPVTRTVGLRHATHVGLSGEGVDGDLSLAAPLLAAPRPGPITPVSASRPSCTP